MWSKQYKVKIYSRVSITSNAKTDIVEKSERLESVVDNDMPAKYC